MTIDPTPRWIYRFDNFKRAFGLLREAIETSQTRELNALEKEGVIQRFQYSWELAWKVLKDYLDAEGVNLPTTTPAAVLKAAIAANILTDGQVWLNALDARNRMSHTYDQKAFEQTIKDIAEHYLAALEALYETLLEKAVNK